MPTIEQFATVQWFFCLVYYLYITFTNFKNVDFIYKQKQYISMKLDLSDKKILIVEDEDINFVLLELYLSDYKINITRCIDSEEFFVHFNDSYDMLLLDIRIPGELLGIDLLAYARHTGYKKPIIMQSAYTEYNDEAMVLGASGFIEKPFDDKDLRELIMDYLV